MSWMLTASGRRVEPAALEPQDILIEDVAAHLAKICRFTGACRIFYSVAEHSVFVADLLADRAPTDHLLQLCGLLHDAPEYLLNDLSTPIKAGLGHYNAMERAAWWAVAERFGLPLTLPWQVKHADLVALATERRDLIHAHPDKWSVLEGIKPCERKLGTVEQHWKVSEQLFLERFHILNAQIAATAARSTH